jgi:hypothetical protein
VRDFSRRTVTISRRAVNPPTEYTVKNPSRKFRNIFMKARKLYSIFLNFSILSYLLLNIHLYRAFGSKLPHTFFTVYKQLIINQLPHGEISRYKAEQRVAIVSDFSLKNKFSDFLGIVKGSLNRAFSVKYPKNKTFLTVWAGNPGFHRAGTCQ